MRASSACSRMSGGQVVQKLWPPLNAPDYGTFIAQLKDVDGIFMSFAGSNGFRFFKQYKEYGGATPILGGMTAVDEAVLQQMGPDAIGMISANWYSAQLDTPSNKAFVAGMQAEYKVDPGYYAAGTYVAAQVMNAALGTIGGKIEDKAAFIKAVREGNFPDTARGHVRFDEFGNVVGNVYIRKVEKKGQPSRQHGDQDLSGRQPVLDLRPGRVPQGAGLRARLLRRPATSTNSAMQFWLIQTLNSVAFGGLLFLLASGFSLIFGLLRIPNLAHGALFMLGRLSRRDACSISAGRSGRRRWPWHSPWAHSAPCSSGCCCAGWRATNRARCW